MRKDVGKGKHWLREVSGLNHCNVYEELMRQIWKGESIDVFATELRRLVKTVDLKGETEVISKHSFAIGISKVTGKELRSLSHIKN